MQDQGSIERFREMLRAECRRVEALLPQYEAIVPTGALAGDILRFVLQEGEASIASGDVARMEKALTSLRSVPQ